MFDVFFKGAKPVSESCKKKCNSEDTRFSVPFKKEGCTTKESCGSKKEGCTTKESCGSKKEGCTTKESHNFKKEGNGKSAKEVEELFNFNLTIASNNSYSKKKKKDEKRKSRKNLRKALMSEALLMMLNESMGIELSNSDSYNLMKRNLVESFVEEKEAENLIAEFKYKSVELANIALLCEEYEPRIFQEVEGEEDEFVINSKEKDDFFCKLKAIDTTEITNLVNARVASAIADFTYQNKNLKDNMQSVLQKSQEIVDTSEDDDIKESASLDAKKTINSLKDNRIKNIFECMVEKISEAAIVNESMTAYMNESGLDMIKIVENAKVMYTFMELLNTARIENVNESYVQDVLDNLK